MSWVWKLIRDYRYHPGSTIQEENFTGVLTLRILALEIRLRVLIDGFMLRGLELRAFVPSYHKSTLVAIWGSSLYDVS